MQRLGIVAAVAALIVALGGATGWLSDTPLASVIGVDITETRLLALAGLALAAVLLRAGDVSTFLRLFLMLFGVEYVLLALAVVFAKAGWLPASLAPIAPPVSMPVTIALFAVIVFFVSLIPVIRTILRLADPYFQSEDRIEVGTPFGRVRMLERQAGKAMFFALVLINQFQVGISVRISFFNRDWFNAIQDKDAARFWSLLLTVFVFWAAIAVVVGLVELYFQYVLQIRWRRWMTERYVEGWVDDGTIYRMTLSGGGGADNPDQRIAEDIKNYINYLYTFSLSLLSQVSSLVSFSIILWSIPVQFTFPGTDVVIPGLLFWVALVYSLIGTLVTHIIGRELIKLDFQQERLEANFRYSLARLREFGEQIALLRGEAGEKQRLDWRFSDIVRNYFAIVYRNLKLNTFTFSYFQASVVFPYVIVAPYYFVGKITLGTMTQVAGAFTRVETSMTWFIQRYSQLAAFKAVVDRLNTFLDAIAKARAAGRGPEHITVATQRASKISIAGLTAKLPTGRVLVEVAGLDFRPNESVLITGPSGSGKSTLLRTIAGIWPYGSGEIREPEGETVMLLPQRPYIPQGSLRNALTYPSIADTYDDAQIRAALDAARLGHLAERLDEEAPWSQTLSGGEQQRFQLARALLAKPKWLFLDEATASLDEPLEAAMYKAIEANLPDTTVISIGHRSTLVAMHDRQLVMEPRADGVFVPTDRLAVAVPGQ